jgi:argininosuccinate lyase
MLIEQRLTEKVGAAGGKLHTGRSRNDQIALDERLFLRAGIDEIAKRLTRLQRALVLKADRYRNLVVPGYTHLQQAQPILHAHHLLAYVEMLERDRERMADCRRRVNCSPLGAAALAGTTLPLDRAGTARALGFKGLLENSIDAVSDRDVQIEFLAAGAITMMHLSRLAEEFVLWSSAEWGFAGIGEEYTTGSSIMPQKRNPDIAELLRGKTGRAYGNLMALLTVMKGLPLAYNRDMQEDKLPLFDTVDTLTKSLEVTSGMVASTEFRERTGFAGGSYDQMLATDLAEYLVTKGIPFREAHAIVGKLVRDSERSTSPLSSFTLAGLRAYSPSFGKDVLSLLDVMRSPGHKRSEGSTSPVHVHRAIGRWKGKLSRRKE